MRKETSAAPPAITCAVSVHPSKETNQTHITAAAKLGPDDYLHISTCNPAALLAHLPEIGEALAAAIRAKLQDEAQQLQERHERILEGMP